MKFTVSTSGESYLHKEDRIKLEAIGFKFNGTGDIKVFPEIEINSLDELLQFIDKFGKIIIDNGSIEIYDDYRE